MMKKLFVVIAIAGLFFTSCSKEYECTCTDIGGFGTAYDKTGKGGNAVKACNKAEEKVLGISLESCTPK